MALPLSINLRVKRCGGQVFCSEVRKRRPQYYADKLHATVSSEYDGKPYRMTQVLKNMNATDVMANFAV